MTFPKCEAFDTPCRFVSNEVLVVPYALLVEDPRTKRLIAGSVVHRSEPLGQWCNNISAWCASLTQCPARLALAYEPWCGQKADGTMSYAKLIGSMEMKALMSERVIGQQVLF